MTFCESMLTASKKN